MVRGMSSSSIVMTLLSSVDATSRRAGPVGIIGVVWLSGFCCEIILDSISEVACE